MSETLPFANLIQDAVQAALDPEKIAKLTQEHVDRLVADAVRKTFDSWSGTGKVISEVVQASLQVKSLDLPSYGHVVSEIVRRAVEARVAEVVAAKLAKDLDDLLHLAPKRMKLSDLVAELLGPEGEEQQASDVICKIDWSSEGWARIELSAKNVDYHDVNVEFHVMLAKKKYTHEETPEGPISFGHVSGMDLKKHHAFGYGAGRSTFSLGRLYGFEQRILALYACATILELDEDAVVTEREY